VLLVACAPPPFHSPAEVVPDFEPVIVQTFARANMANDMVTQQGWILLTYEGTLIGCHWHYDDEFGWDCPTYDAVEHEKLYSTEWVPEVPAGITLDPPRHYDYRAYHTAARHDG
jgi:hypothetical protein